MSQWKKCPGNPIVRPQPGTWTNNRCTSCATVFKDGTCYFYHDGGIGTWWEGHPGFNWLGLLTCPQDEFDGKTFTPFVCNPILVHGRFNDPDRLGMIGPRVRIINDKFYLYYNTMSYVGDFVPGKCPMWRKQIGCAISDDGINFTKVTHAVSAMPDGLLAACPNPVFHGGRWHMLSVGAPIDGSRPIYLQLQVGDDPLRFDDPPVTVLEHGEPGAWDSKSFGATAVCAEPIDGWYYLLYGGTSSKWDYPEGIGLARSRDLRHWEKHPDNPVVRRGESGAFDDGAIWPTEFIRCGDTFYAWYEGRSAGRDRSVEYSPNATKQIGMMTCSGPLWPA